MKVRFSTILDRIRSSYWFVPAAMSLMAIALSTLMLYLDRRFADRSPSDAWWLYGGGTRAPGSCCLPTRFDADAKAVRAPRGDHLQIIEHERLMELAVENDLVIRLRARPGDFVVQGRIVAHVWKGGDLDPERQDEVREVFVLGRSRSLQQDAEFGILQLVEVAVRALSTGINDPFTAMNCVDRVSSLLCRLSGRACPGPERFDDDGRLRVVADTSSIGGFVDSGCNQIRQNAGRSMAVLIRMLEALESIGTQDSTLKQRQVLEHHAALVLEAGQSHSPPEPDRMDPERAHASALGVIHSGRAYGSRPFFHYNCDLIGHSRRSASFSPSGRRIHV